MTILDILEACLLWPYDLTVTGNLTIVTWEP